MWSFNRHLQLSRNSYLKKIKTICSDFKICRATLGSIFCFTWSNKNFQRNRKVGKSFFSNKFHFFSELADRCWTLDWSSLQQLRNRNEAVTKNYKFDFFGANLFQKLWNYLPDWISWPKSCTFRQIWATMKYVELFLERIIDCWQTLTESRNSLYRIL